MGVRHYYFYIFIFNLLCCFRAEAQSVAVGLSLGVGNYSGDLTENVANVVKQSHPAGGRHGAFQQGREDGVFSPVAVGCGSAPLICRTD